MHVITDAYTSYVAGWYVCHFFCVLIFRYWSFFYEIKWKVIHFSVREQSQKSSQAAMSHNETTQVTQRRKKREGRDERAPERVEEAVQGTHATVHHVHHEAMKESPVHHGSTFSVGGGPSSAPSHLLCLRPDHVSWSKSALALDTWPLTTLISGIL